MPSVLPLNTPMRSFETAAVIDVVLVVLNSLGILRPGLLPLGGGEIQQIGILFSVAFVYQMVSPWLRRQ